METPLGSVRRGEAVGYVDEMALAQGFVRAFARACANGIPARLRENVRAYRMDGGTHVVDERSIAHDRKTRELRSVRQRYTNALTGAENATSDAVITAMMRRADELATLLSNLERELSDLDAAPSAPAAPTFEAATDVLLAALANLASARRWTPEEAAAWRIIVPSLQLERRTDGVWQATASVRLPVKDGVAELGPIHWAVPAPGVGPASMRTRVMTSSRSSGLGSGALRRALEVDAGLAPQAARLLVAAPFPELAHLVLHAKVGRDLPDWVDQQWRDPRFIAHLVAVYGVAPEDWGGPTLYGRRMPRAQAVVDCTADAGRLTLGKYRQVLPGVDANEMWVFSRTEVVSGRERGAVVDKRVADDGTWFLVNRLCRCGQPALVVARAPEIPGSLLCECGLAVDAAPGSTADGVRFPDPYLRARVPREYWMRDMRRTNGLRQDELSEVSPRQAQILQVLLDHPENSLSCAELALSSGMDRQTCQWNIHQLRRRQFVTGSGSPARFALVDATDTEQVLARSWRRRPPSA